MGVYVMYALVAGFLLGVTAGSLGVFAVAGLALLLSVAYVALALVNRRHASLCIVCAVATAAFVCGVVRVDASRLTVDPVLAQYLGMQVVLDGTVVAEPDVRESNVRLTVEVDTITPPQTDGARPASGRVLVIAPAHTGAGFGDRVQAGGVLRRPAPFETGFGRSFDYPMFLAKDGITLELAFAEVTAAPSALAYSDLPKATALRIKQAFVDGLRAALPEPESSLAAGITVGDKRSVGEDLSTVFKTVSLTHVIVLSGYNITVVMDAVRSLLSFAPRTIQGAGLGLAVVFVVLMTGGAAAAVRAGAMALIAVYARASGREFIALRVLAVVTFAMVAWNPLILIYDPGFQLSILATLGLILFAPLVESHLEWVTTRGGLREIVCSTVSAQVAVLPLLLYQSGSLSLVALPANILVLGAIPSAMFFSLIAAIAGAMLGPIAVPLGFPALLLLSYVIHVASTFAALPFASVTIPAFGPAILLAAYACMTVLYSMLRIRGVRRETLHP